MSPTLDVLWFTARVVIVLTFWRVLSSLPEDYFLKALQYASVCLISGVLIQATLMILGQSGVLESLGFTTRTAGIGLPGIFGRIGRAGTFPNGQELGLVAGSLGILLLRARRRFLGGCSLLCVGYSISTAALVGLAVSLAIVLIFSRRSLGRIGIGIFGGGALYAASRSVVLAKLFNYQLAKLGFISSEISWAGQSLDIRSQKTSLAFGLANDHPAFGVGAGRFANRIDLYSVDPSIPTRALVTVENGYGQVAAEHGYVALALFAGFIAVVLAKSVARYDAGLVCAVVFMALVVGSQSMWTSTSIWIAFGFICSALNTSPSHLINASAGVSAPFSGPKGVFTHVDEVVSR
ncbi:O-antigen ligase family protein [Nocardioides sp.]|uniref:O-antigen ligase family protein n=1 Tax=Nocardioides sp. TaxID=35761 RepID=UPI00260B8289|nr:O-antigen ligase family protein [Nocardioides sp.]